MPPTVVVATTDDVDLLADVFARAFTDDPIWTWVYPQTDRTPRLTTMFRSLLHVMIARGAMVLTDESRRGVAVWQRSDQRSLGLLGNLRMGRAMVASGARLRRGQTIMRAVERRHPHEPHWYLAALGTDPPHQGQGVGSALMGHVLDDPPNAHEAAYLETETEANVAFYHRHRFQVVDELDVPGGGPHLWFMWRDPQAP